MTASGTYDWQASNATVMEMAYSRIGIRRSAMLQEHVEDAATEQNLLLGEFSNRQINLFRSETYEFDLEEGVATYTLRARDVMIISCYLRTGEDESQQDRIMWPVSTVEYASYPTKNSEGYPSTFWFNRQIVPQITFWQVPDADDTYTARLQIATQMQDANLASGETPDLPYRWYDVFVAGLAYRLARIYKPELEVIRKGDYDQAWAIAATQDVENTQMNIIPQVYGYYR